MARIACVSLLLAAAGLLAEAQNVRVTWIGQSCFVIRTEGGPTVVTDPPVASTGYPLPALAAGVGGQFTVVDGRPVAARTEMTAAHEQLAGLRDFDAERAAAPMKQLKPRVAIAMHFRTALGGPAQMAAFPDAVRPLEPLVYKPSRVMVNRATLPSTQVGVMEASADVAAVNAASSAPGLAGLWQVNAAIPADASPGPDVSVLIIHGGIASNQLSVAME